ncbi:MAG: EspA/EspE family type VII secretion system effector, partial [Vicinamibacterales bacterium]|nr:EspA/EspE family type VII secretion system effector [Vicinamibacterales bacterium]
MGVFDGIEDAGKAVGGLVDVHGAPSTLPGPTAAAPGGSRETVQGAVDSEILDAGQRLIAGMRLTTGWGDPEQGEPFGQGAAHFSSAGETVVSAAPGGDWDGGGAEAYATANRRQADRSAALAALDRGVHTVIAREAHQVAYHRGNLEDQANSLGDLGYLTSTMTRIPGVGKAMKSAVELAAVNAALTVCSVELYQLSQEVGENASQLRELAGGYSALAEGGTAPPELQDAPPQPPTDDSPVPDPTDRPAPDQPAPSPGAVPPGALAAAAPAPAAVAAGEQPVGPAERAAPAAPAEAMSGMAS